MKIYTFLAPDGHSVHYDIGKFRALLVLQPNWFVLAEGPLTSSVVRHFVTHCGVEECAVADITPRYAVKPGFGVILENETVEIIDGHHRAVWLYRNGARAMRCYACDERIALRYCQANLSEIDADIALKTATEQLPVRAQMKEGKRRARR